MQRRPPYLEIFLVSFAVLLLQIAYTRIFSFKVSSYFTYLIIGFAMLGVGSGGVFVALSSRLRAIRPERLIAALAPAGALVVALGYAVVAALALDLSTDAARPGQIARLAFVCSVLYAGFLAMGVVVAAILAGRPQGVSRLYAADLAGAGAGCAAAIPLLVALTPPGCIFAAASAFAGAGACAALRDRRGGAIAGSIAALAALAGLALAAERLPDPVVDRGKTLGAEQVQRLGITRVFHRWSPVFRVDVLESPLWPHLKVLAHDGLWGSALWRVDPSDGGFARVDTGIQRLAFAAVRPQPGVLVIGAAGGHEVMASIHFGAAHVTGVELNPVSISLLEEHFADYTGRVARHERVTLVNAEGRSFLRSNPSRYDLVYFVAPDSYATMNAAQASGFVLAESYLYTVEAIQAALGRLAPGGLLAIQFGEVDPNRPVRTLRYLATARRALEGLGVHEFARHVLVATTRQSMPLLHAFPVSTILVGAAPFGAAEIDRFFAAADAVPVTTVDHALGRASARGAVGRVIELPSERLARLYASYPYRIDPVFDDAPYFWHFVSFRKLLGAARLSMAGDPSVAQGESALVVMLVLSTLFALVFLILPFAVVRDRFARLPHKRASVPYFAALGLGFMGFEVCLIQKLTLFLGYPTRALTVTLCALLVAAGLGSWLSGRVVERRDRVLLLLVSALLLLTAFYRSGLDRLVDAAGGAPLAARIALAVGVLTPLGLVLGAFLPLGLASVSRASPPELRSEYVAWSWAVNGFFSVVGSILVTIVSMSYGFRTVLLLAAALYVAAALCLRALPLAQSSES
jgi:hypothetical protein